MIEEDPLNQQLTLGIDTSNYKTSVAIVNHKGEIVKNYQQFLFVKSGERGLRQSDAFFQHIQKLPIIFEEIFSDPAMKRNLKAVSVSTRPRPVEGSYMPVFTAGTSFAKTIASSLGIPLFEFSHQEGHLEAILHGSRLQDKQPIICFHFSGGTTEALLYRGDASQVEIIGGTKDISFGQVLDRIGVAMGYPFPCGQQLDQMALQNIPFQPMLTKLKVKEGYVNLSGIESQCQRMITQGEGESLIPDLFQNISHSILNMTKQLSEKYNVKDFVYAGGVSSSQYLRNYLNTNCKNEFHIVFGDEKLSSDNAIGIALLGGKQIWG